MVMIYKSFYENYSKAVEEWLSNLEEFPVEDTPYLSEAMSVYFSWFDNDFYEEEEKNLPFAERLALHAKELIKNGNIYDEYYEVDEQEFEEDNEESETLSEYGERLHNRLSDNLKLITDKDFENLKRMLDKRLS